MDDLDDENAEALRELGEMMGAPPDEHSVPDDPGGPHPPFLNFWAWDRDDIDVALEEDTGGGIHLLLTVLRPDGAELAARLVAWAERRGYEVSESEDDGMG